MALVDGSVIIILILLYMYMEGDQEWEIIHLQGQLHT